LMRPKILLGYITMIWRSPDSWKRFLLNIGGFLRFALTDKRIADTGKEQLPSTSTREVTSCSGQQ
jgi:hypothetical protein